MTTTTKWNWYIFSCHNFPIPLIYSRICMYVSNLMTLFHAVSMRKFFVLLYDSCERRRRKKICRTERTVFTSAYSTQNQLLCMPHVYVLDIIWKMDRTKISSIKAYSRPYRNGYVAQLNVQAHCSNVHAYRAPPRNISLLHCCSAVRALLCSLARSRACLLIRLYSLFLHFSLASLSLARSYSRSVSLFIVMHPSKLTMVGKRYARNSNTTAHRCHSEHMYGGVCVCILRILKICRFACVSRFLLRISFTHPLASSFFHLFCSKIHKRIMACAH